MVVSVVWRKRSRRSPVWEPANGWIRICEIIFFPLSHMFGRRRLVGLEHMHVPGPVLVVGNHISHLDPLYSATAIRKGGRWPHIMAKASLWKIPVVGKVLVGTRTIPVQRDGGGKAALETGQEYLRAGKAVCLYPEGTITRDPGDWPMKPHPGAAVMALTVPGVVVVPMAIWGTQQVMPPYVKKGKLKLFPRKDITVRFGRPVDLTAFAGREADNRAVIEVSNLLMAAVRDELALIRGEEAPTEFFDMRKAERLAKRKAQGES